MISVGRVPRVVTRLAFPARPLSVVALDALQGAHVDITLTTEATAGLAPSRDGGPLRAVGSGDRGAGLMYKAGRLAPTPAALDGPAAKPEGVFVTKVQPPLDNSSDARGGIGRMTPATLLVHDAQHAFIHFVSEDDRGHTSLLRQVLRQRGQVGYFYATLPDENTLRVFIEESPPEDLTDF